MTSTDLSYSKKEFREFILDSREMGVNIVPEFDAPGHSGAFMDVRPDLHLKKTVEGNAARAGNNLTYLMNIMLIVLTLLKSYGMNI